MQKDMMCKIIQNIMLNKNVRLIIINHNGILLLPQCYLYYINDMFRPKVNK